MRFEFEGMNELLQTFEQMETGAKNGKEKALQEGAKVMQKSAQSLARRRTGNLVAHIEISEVQNDEIDVYVDNQGKAYYGHMLEFGTSKMPAYPFMGPAFLRDKHNIELAMANEMRKQLGLML